MMTEDKVDIATIMHEDIETTIRIYTHVTNKTKKMLPTNKQICTETSFKK